MTDSHKYEFDKLQLYFAEPYIIKIRDNDGNVINEITITQPTIGDIIKVGENLFYQTLYTFVLNPTSLRLQLWEANIDWNTLSDYQLFYMRMKGMNPIATKLLFGNVNFDGFELYNKKLKDNSEAITLYNPEQRIEIDEETYNHIAQYLRTMFDIFPKVEKTKGRTMKEWLIEEERDKLKVAKDNEQKSVLLPLISTYINHPGTKYKSNELKEVGIYEFMDSIRRIQIYESTTALMSGMYSGMVSMKDMDKEALNFMRDK